MDNLDSANTPQAKRSDQNENRSSFPLAGKKFLVRTFGCQMNVADSDRMNTLLTERGMTPTDEAREASVILINGCTVREKAVHKAISALGRYQDLQVDGQKPLIGVGGCVGQLDKQSLFKNAPYLDFVLGTDTIDSLPEILYRVHHGEKHVVFAEFDRTQDYTTETRLVGARKQAFVNIMKGCDKFCTYCIVPYTRGREKSRTIDEVLDDLAHLAAQGVVEVTLLGQNVNSFGKGNPNLSQREPQELHNQIGKVGPRAGEENFPQLLRAIDADPRCAGIQRLRFTSSHPLDFSDELIDCYRPGTGVSKLARHLHLPVQSGSNRVLQKMGRHHKIEAYISQMLRLKEILPDVGMSTDLIVGFPTETEDEFQETLKLIEVIQYDALYAFAYSPRPGTRAAKLPDDVSDEVKNRRLNELLQLGLKIAERRFSSLVGKRVEVLVEGEAKNQKHLDRERNHSPSGLENARVWMGRTSCNKVVNFVADSPRDLVGRFLNVEIVSASATSLRGKWEGEALHEPLGEGFALTSSTMQSTLSAQGLQ